MKFDRKSVDKILIITVKDVNVVSRIKLDNAKLVKNYLYFIQKIEYLNSFSM